MGLRQRSWVLLEVEDRAAQAAWGAGRPARYYISSAGHQEEQVKLDSPDLARQMLLQLQAGVGRQWC